MQPLRLTRRQSREVDRIAIEEYGIPCLVLMENAATAITNVVAMEGVRRLKVDRTVVIVCGKGNNGGDGLAVARHLRTTLRTQRDVRVLLTDPPDRFTGDAAVQLGIIQKMGMRIEQADAFLASADAFGGVLVDAVYGTGFRPPARINFRPLNARVRRGGALVVSVDLPSGMDADSGQVIDGNAVIAAWTLTMVTEKVGFAAPGATAYLGQIRVVNLRIPDHIVERAAASPA